MMFSSNSIFDDIVAEFKEKNKEVQNEDKQMQKENEEAGDGNDEVQEQPPPVPVPVYVLPKIDLATEFSLYNIVNKAGDYEDDEQVVSDLGRVLRFIVGRKMLGIMKTFNASTGWVVDIVAFQDMKSQLNMIKLQYHEKDHYSVGDVFQRYIHYFSLLGVHFSSKNDDRLFNLYRGWFYDSNNQFDGGILKPFFKFVLEIISNGDPNTASQILCWVASIIQNVGKKTGIALLLIGDEGAGKNFFTNILSTLFRGYSLPNITDLAHVVGHFNEIIRGKVLIVVNEVENMQTNPKSLTEKLRSLITDQFVAVGQKYKETTLDINNANFILVSNHNVPVRVEVNDRRYLVARVSSKKVQNVDYFAELFEQTKGDVFFQALTTFFKTYNLSQYKPNEGLMNQAKRDVIKQSINLIDSFVIKHYTQLCKGMSSESIIPLIYASGFKSKDMFFKSLASVCDKRVLDYKTKTIYTLKDWAVVKYMSIAESAK